MATDLTGLMAKIAGRKVNLAAMRDDGTVPIKIVDTAKTGATIEKETRAVPVMVGGRTYLVVPGHIHPAWQFQLRREHQADRAEAVASLCILEQMPDGSQRPLIWWEQRVSPAGATIPQEVWTAIHKHFGGVV